MSNFIKIRLFEGRIILLSFNNRFYKKAFNIIIRKKKHSDLFLSLASTDANDIIRCPGSSLKYITYQVFSLSFRKK